MQGFRPRTLLHAACAALVVAAAAGYPAPVRAAGAQAQSPQALQEEAQKVSMQLGEIARKAIAGDKKLQAEGQAYSQHMIEAMKTIGYTPVADGKRMTELGKEINSGKLSQEERAAKIQEFQGLRIRMMQAQAAVMQDKALSKERMKLNQDTVAAMKKVDPNTEALMQRMKQISQQLQGMYRQSQAPK